MDGMDRGAARLLPRVGVVGAVAVTLAVALAGTAEAQTQPVFVNGQAQVVPAFNVSAEWIRHRLWVETEFDSDGDGKRDRMHVDVTRPAQTNTEGLRVPVIYETSPYYAGTSGPQANLWNVNHELGVAPPARISQPAISFNPNRTSISNSEVNNWVPRGFAVVHSESPGTGLSQGCPTVGGSNENDGPKAVVDWLNGRAKGYTTIDGDLEVKADWATGKVGMTGTSYNGTLPISAATTGVAGLEAIIPIAPNTSYYHYYRSNGLVRNPGGWVGEDIDFLFDYINSGDPARRQYCIDTVREGLMKLRQDRVTGDYNDFWAGRDQLNQLSNVKAATLMAHAFNDWNVVPEHSVRIAEALKGKVPLQQFYHQGGHGGAPPFGLRNRWFTRYLYGIQNGVENDPKAWVTREAAACPPRTAVVVGDQAASATLAVANSGQLQVGMTLTIPQTNAAGTTTNVTRAIVSIPNATSVVLDSAVATAAGDKVAEGATVSIVCSTANPTPYADYPNPAAKAVELRPQAGGNTTGALSSVAPPASGREMLVDDVSCQPGNFVTSGPQRLLYSTPTLTAPLHLSGTPKVKVRMAASKAAANLSVWLVALPFTPSVTCTSTSINTSHVITRGWADPQNRGAVSGGAPLVPGEFVDVLFSLQPTDKVVLQGQQLALMVFSSDRLFTLRPQPGTEVTVDLAGTALSIPVVGGSKAFTTATGGDEEEAPVGGTVSATLSLTLGAPALFGAFTPGVAREYTASTTANVISSAGDAALTVSDPSSQSPGHLVNGVFALPQPLQGLGTIKTYTGPVSNDSVTVQFKQQIAATDALRTGTYAKTLTFTLSTTSP